MIKRPDSFGGIHNIPLRIRRKILRVLIEHKRVGTEILDPRSTDLRLICSKEQLFAALDCLENYGHIVVTRAKDANIDELPPMEIVGIQLTNKGAIFFEELSDDRRRFFYRSVIVPILLSTVSAVITTYLLR